MRKIFIRKIRGVIIFAFIVAIGFFLIFGATAIFAQEETPGGPPEGGVQGPSEEEINQFEREFGAPPESFEEPEIERPEYEEPGQISEEIKKYVTEKELVEVYCAMTRWKSGQFFAAMDALKKYLIPAMEQVKADLGVAIEIPNVDALRAEGEKRVGAVCSASTVSEAEKLVKDFIAWSQQEASPEKFNSFRGELQTKLKAEGDELRDKVKAAAQTLANEEKARVEAEIKQEVDRIVNAKKAELAGSKAIPDISGIKAEIQARVDSLVATKKAEIESKIRNKVNEIVGGQKEKFDSVGKIFQGIGQQINNEIKTSLSQYDQYKTQAFALRKAMVLKVLDQNLEDGMKQLDAAATDLEEAKKEDSSLKGAGEIRAELQADRRALEAKLDAALEAGDETAFQNALNDFRVKWEEYRRESEKAAGQGVSKACTVALAQFSRAKNQMEPGLKQINNLLSKCAASTTDECLKVNEFASRFNTLTSKISDLKTEMSIAEKMCQTPETADRQNLIALMKKIQSDGEDLKVYGEALEAEKSKTIADTAQKICAQILPQLDAVKTEMAKNDLTVLQNNIDKCRGKSTEECRTVNVLVSKFNQVNSKIQEFSGEIVEAETLCRIASEENLERLKTVLYGLKAKGEEARLAAKELQEEQAENSNTKAVCRAVMPQMEAAKGEISAGLREMNSIQMDCAGKTGKKCAAVSALSSKFTDVNGQVKAILNKISQIGGICQTAGAEAPQQNLLDLLEQVKKDKDTVKQAIADLKSKADKAAPGQGVWIEAEDEVSSKLLAHTKQWHSHKWTQAASWRPPLFGGYWYLSRGGESLSYSFEVSAAGKYNIWIRDYVDKFQERGVRRIVIEIDGKKYGTFAETTVAAPGDKGAFGWHKNGDGLQLGAGKHSMKITKEATTAGAAILDAFYLTTGTEVPPEK